MLCSISSMYTDFFTDWFKIQPSEYRKQKFLSRILLSLDDQAPPSFLSQKINPFTWHFFYCIKKINACCLKYLSSEDSIRTCWYNLKIPPQKKRKVPLLTIITTNYDQPLSFNIVYHKPLLLRFDDVPLSQQETCRHSTVQWENPARGSDLDSDSTPSVSSVASVGDFTFDH